MLGNEALTVDHPFVRYDMLRGQPTNDPGHGQHEPDNGYRQRPPLSDGAVGQRGEQHNRNEGGEGEDQGNDDR